MSKFTLFDIISEDLHPDFNPYFCLIQNGWDNCFISLINTVSNKYFTQYWNLIILHTQSPKRNDLIHVSLLWQMEKRKKNNGL